MRINVEIDANLARRLTVLENQPRRNPEKAAQGRAAYLDQAQQLANSSFSAVTAEEKQRHIGWMHPLQQWFRFQKKEHSPMFGSLGTILLIISLVLGGSGATVAAAQSSLPDQALYPVKTWSEDARVQMSSNTQTRLALALEYSQRRVEEMQVMLRAGQNPPETVLARMQAEIDLALRLAAGQPDSDAVKALEQIHEQIQAHEQAFKELRPGAGAHGNAILDQTQTMLQDRLHLCDQGIQNPDLLRQQLRDRDRLHDGTGSHADPDSSGKGNPWTTGTPTPGSSYGSGPGDGAGNTGGAGSTGGNGGNNPWTTGTPTPNSGYGPGPGDGAGSTGGNRGNNPWTTGTPTPGSGYGPGPGDGAGGTGGAGSTGGSGAGSDDGTGGAGSGTGGSNQGGTSGGNPNSGSGSGSGGSGTGGSGSGSGSGAGSGGAGTGGSGAGGSGGRP